MLLCCCVSSKLSSLRIRSASFHASTLASLTSSAVLSSTSTHASHGVGASLGDILHLSAPSASPQLVAGMDGPHAADGMAESEIMASINRGRKELRKEKREEKMFKEANGDSSLSLERTGNDTMEDDDQSSNRATKRIKYSTDHPSSSYRSSPSFSSPPLQPSSTSPVPVHAVPAFDLDAATGPTAADLTTTSGSTESECTTVALTAVLVDSSMSVQVNGLTDSVSSITTLNGQLSSGEDGMVLDTSISSTRSKLTCSPTCSAEVDKMDGSDATFTEQTNGRMSLSPGLAH